MIQVCTSLMMVCVILTLMGLIVVIVLIFSVLTVEILMIMRKRFIERLSFYKLLEELNELPEECSTFPVYIDKIDDKKLEFVDFYVTFTRHYLDENDNDDARFTLLFMYKSKNVRLCSQARFAFEIDLRDFELTQFCFNSKILTVSDFFQAALGECVDYTQSLVKVQSSDNERFALIQT